MKKLPVVFNQAEKSVDVLLYDVIGAGWFFDGVSAKELAKDLNAHGPLEYINVRINSPGGIAHDGIAIYNTLKANPAKKVVIVEGLAASAASVVAMVGDEIIMHANTQQMCHDAMGGNFGRAADLRKEADVLDMLTGQIVDTYAARTKLPREEVAALMTAETWFTPELAVEKGFATRVEENKQAAVNGAWDLSRFKNVPANFLQMINQAKQQSREDHADAQLSAHAVAVKLRMIDLDDAAEKVA